MSPATQTGAVVRVWWGERLIDQRFVPEGRAPVVEPGLRVELSSEEKPELVPDDPFQAFRDFAVPILLLSCLLGALVLAVVPSLIGYGSDGGDSYGDDGEVGRNRRTRLSKFIDHRPSSASARVARREAIIVTPKPTSGGVAKRKPNKTQPRDDVKDAKELVKKVFAGVGNLVTRDDALEIALVNLKSASAGASAGDFGLSGSGTRGFGSGIGGGLGSGPVSAEPSGEGLGLGSLGTRGRGGGTGGYGSGVGILTGKKDTDIGITVVEPTVIGSLDRELIRKVMRAHASQIRYCYEFARTTEPSLQGRLAVKFVIAPNGDVATVSTHESIGSEMLEACVTSRVRTFEFPRSPSGGVSIVTWPWVFAAAN